MSSKESSTWRPITDIPSDIKALQLEDLSSLAEIWKEQSERLRDSEAVKLFNEKLCREWAIETGIIEGLYSIDRGITQLLIEKGIEASLIPHGTTDRPVSDIVPILHAQQDTLEGIFDFVASRRSLTTSYVKELHQSLTRNQTHVDAIDGMGNKVQAPLLRGDWKRQPNNPTRPDGAVHQYCPPEHVATEMERLLALHAEHGTSDVSPTVEAAWLHHRFTQIHPFQDGNGRVARALASLVFLRTGWFPLVINRDIREVYIKALESADRGDLAPLLNLFRKIQKDAFVKALSLSEDALKQTEPLDQVLARAAEKLHQRKFAEMQRIEKQAIGHAIELQKQAVVALGDVCDKLKPRLMQFNQRYNCGAEESAREKNDFWYGWQIVNIARKLGYFADTRSYRSWARLWIYEDRHTDLVCSFHALGRPFLGVMAVSAFLQFRDKTEGKEASTDGPHLLCDEVFQFSYRESIQDILPRFERWLADVILVGMNRWQSQL